MLHLSFEGIGTNAPVVIKQTLAQGVECDTAVHRTRVDIDVAHLAGQVLGHRALSARAVAIDGNRYLFHNAYDMLISNDEALT